MGISTVSGQLVFVDKLFYQAKYNDELSEHEVDHVLVGEWDGNIVLNPDEAAASQWKPWDDLIVDMKEHPTWYTPWFVLMIQDNRLQRSINTL